MWSIVCSLQFTTTMTGVTVLARRALRLCKVQASTLAVAFMTTTIAIAAYKFIGARKLFDLILPALALACCALYRLSCSDNRASGGRMSPLQAFKSARRDVTVLPTIPEDDDEAESEEEGEVTTSMTTVAANNNKHAVAVAAPAVVVDNTSVQLAVSKKGKKSERQSKASKEQHQHTRGRARSGSSGSDSDDSDACSVSSAESRRSEASSVASDPSHASVCGNEDLPMDATVPIVATVEGGVVRKGAETWLAVKRVADGARRGDFRVWSDDARDNGNGKLRQTRWFQAPPVADANNRGNSPRGRRPVLRLTKSSKLKLAAAVNATGSVANFRWAAGPDGTRGFSRARRVVRAAL